MSAAYLVKTQDGEKALSWWNGARGFVVSGVTHWRVVP